VKVIAEGKSTKTRVWAIYLV